MMKAINGFAGIYWFYQQIWLLGHEGRVDDGFPVFKAFRLVEAVVLSTFKYSSILFAAAFGYLFWGEWLDLWAAAGAVLIVVSGLVILRYRHRPAPTLADVMPRSARDGN